MNVTLAWSPPADLPSVRLSPKAMSTVGGGGGGARSSPHFFFVFGLKPFRSSQTIAGPWDLGWGWVVGGGRGGGG